MNNSYYQLLKQNFLATYPNLKIEERNGCKNNAFLELMFENVNNLNETNQHKIILIGYKTFCNIILLQPFKDYNHRFALHFLQCFLAKHNLLFHYQDFWEDHNEGFFPIPIFYDVNEYISESAIASLKKYITKKICHK